MKIKAIAVFCGSKNGNNPLYCQHAAELGEKLARENIALVYGGGSRGLMGAIADSMLLYQGKVIGIIPSLLVNQEHQHNGLTELTIVEDMHARKKAMYELCDAAVILPGGLGTMDELFEMVTWNQLSIHDKRIFLVNSGGYYDHLLAHMNQMQQQGFLYDAPNLVVYNSPGEIVFY